MRLIGQLIPSGIFWVLIFTLFIGWAIISYLLTKKEIVWRKTGREFPSLKYAFDFSTKIVLIFLIVGVSYVFASLVRSPLAGVGFIFILPCATLLGIGGFIISWLVISLYRLFSTKSRSTISNKKLKSE